MAAKRLELTVSEDLWERIESARGDVPRAAFVKRALEGFVASGAVQEPQPQDNRPRKSRLPPPRPAAVRPQVVRASSLVTTELSESWEELMLARQARLNRKREQPKGAA